MDIQNLRNQIKTTDINKIQSIIDIAKTTGQINKLWRPYLELFKWLLSWGDELYDNVDESYRNATSRAEKITLINTRIAINESDNSHLYKEMRFLPSSIGLLCSLERFIVGDNELMELPKSFTNLIKLKEVYLSNNEIWTLPKGFENLQNLENLNLNKNRFSKVPSCIKEMPSLENLSLANNPIDKLPDDLGLFKNIKQLNLSNTNIDKADFEQLKKQMPHIKLWH